MPITTEKDGALLIECGTGDVMFSPAEEPATKLKMFVIAAAHKPMPINVLFHDMVGLPIDERIYVRMTFAKVECIDALIEALKDARKDMFGSRD